MGSRLELNYAAGAPHLKLSIILNIPPPIARVDIDKTAAHTNQHPRPPGVSREVRGHNYHCWADNKPPAGGATIPRLLRIARPLEEKLAVYPKVLLWFCAEHNIEINRGLIPDLPSRETLL